MYTLNEFSKPFERFILDERAAITIDWVVLTAGVVALAIGAYTTLGVSADDPFPVDETANELDMYAKWEMGMYDGQAPMQRLITGAKVKLALFRACLGMGMTWQGHNIVGKGQESRDGWCALL